MLLQKKKRASSGRNEKKVNAINAVCDRANNELSGPVPGKSLQGRTVISNQDTETSGRPEIFQFYD